MPTPPPIKLVCFDMDGTLFNIGVDPHAIKHLQHEEYYSLEQAVRETIAKGGVRNQKALLATIRGLLSRNIRIAITSLTSMPEAVPYALREIGLEPGEIRKIAICCGIPEGDDAQIPGKNWHIAKAMQVSRIINLDTIVLVDDNQSNVEAARRMGCHAIHAARDRDGVEYLDQLRRLAGLSRLSPLLIERAPPPAKPSLS